MRLRSPVVPEAAGRIPCDFASPPIRRTFAETILQAPRARRVDAWEADCESARAGFGRTRPRFAGARPEWAVRGKPEE